MAEHLAEQLSDKNIRLRGDTSSLDTDALLKLQQAQLERDRREAKERVRMLVKRHDHLQRAYKREEIPLLELDYERQKKVDVAYHKALVEKIKSTAIATHEENVKLKHRLGRMRSECSAFCTRIETERKARYQERLAAAQIELAAAKEARLKEWEAQKEQERKDAAEKAEKDRIRKEAEEREAAERKAREEEEREKREKEHEELMERRRYLIPFLIII